SASSSFCMRAASSPLRTTSLIGFIVTSANSGLKRALPSADFTATRSCGAVVERRLHQPALVRSGCKDDLAAMLEQKSDRTVRAQVATMLGERMPDIGDGSRAIVRQAVDNHRRPIDPVTLVADLFVINTFL